MPTPQNDTQPAVNAHATRSGRPATRKSVDRPVRKQNRFDVKHGVPCEYVLSVVNHLTRYALRIPVPNEEATSIAGVVLERVFAVFVIQEELHSDRGAEFGNRVNTRAATRVGLQ